MKLFNVHISHFYHFCHLTICPGSGSGNRQQGQDQDQGQDWIIGSGTQVKRIISRIRIRKKDQDQDLSSPILGEEMLSRCV